VNYVVKNPNDNDLLKFIENQKNREIGLPL